MVGRVLPSLFPGLPPVADEPIPLPGLLAGSFTRRPPRDSWIKGRGEVGSNIGRMYSSLIPDTRTVEATPRRRRLLAARVNHVYIYVSRWTHHVMIAIARHTRTVS